MELLPPYKYSMPCTLVPREGMRCSSSSAGPLIHRIRVRQRKGESIAFCRGTRVFRQARPETHLSSTTAGHTQHSAIEGNTIAHRNSSDKAFRSSSPPSIFVPRHHLTWGVRASSSWALRTRGVIWEYSNVARLGR